MNKIKRKRAVPHSFEENIAIAKAELEAQLAKLRPGSEMEAIQEKIRQLRTATHMNEWLRSPGLKSPN